MRRSFFAIAIATLVLLAAAETYHFLPWNFDDAYIIFRIARNLLRGDGWSFNPGEVHNPSTSVLNTVLVAAAGAAVRDVPRAAHLLGGLWLAATGIAVAWMFRAKFDDWIGLATGAATIGLLADGSTWGLEIHLFFCLLALFLVLELRGKNPWYVIGLLTLARPDAMLFAALRWLRGAWGSRLGAWVVTDLKGVLQFLLVLSPWVVFSVAHFHQVFPDTLSNKIWQGHSGYWGTGPVYLKGLVRHFLDAGPLLQSGYILAIPGTWLLIRDRSVLLYAVAFAALQQAVYIVLNVPGYHWYFSILDGVVVLTAFYAIGSAWAIVVRRFLLDQGRRALVGATGFLAVLAVTAVYARAAAADVQAQDGRDDAYRRTVEILKKNRIPLGAVAAVEVGTFGYYLDQPTVDLTGLTSPNPEFVSGTHNDRFFANAPPTVLFHAPLWPFEQALYHDLRFRMMYGRATGVADPAIPMQYFLLKPGARSPSSAEIDAYVQEQYPPFRLEVADVLVHPQRSADAVCFVDLINGQLAGTGPHRLPPPVLSVAGWAVDRITDAPAEAYVLLSSWERRFALKATRVQRPDVAAVLKDPRFEWSGFEVQGSITGLPPGPYRLGVAQRRGDGFVYCEFPNALTVR